MHERKKMSTAKRSTGLWYNNFLFACIIVICGIIPFVSISLASGLPQTWQLKHEAFHAVMETLGCMLALGIAGFLLMRQAEKGNEYKLWLACSMLSMAILDAFHASVEPSREFICLHSTAQFIGGVFIALIWLPERLVQTRNAKQLPKLFVAAAGLFGVISLVFPEILPTMMINGRFTFVPQILNLTGGVLFFAGLVYFASRFSRDRDNTHLLFAAYCLMFAVSGVTFGRSGLWGAGWWLSHLIRLGAYVIAFSYVSINTAADYLRLTQTEEAVMRLAAIVESSDDAIIGKALDGTIVSWNLGAKNIYGYSAEEVQGQSGSVLIPPDRPDEEVKILGRIKKGQRVDCFETVRKKKDGELIDVSLSISPIEDSHGKIIGISTIARDITERKRAEEELERLNKHLESAVRELKRVNKELQEFAHIAAHDLKAPLQAIGTLADWILADYADKFDERGKEQVMQLVTRARQMSALVNDILQYSRLGQSGLKKEQVDLNTVLSEIIAGIDPPENIEMTVENKLPVLMCEKTHMIQVFQNLLSNAVKYMDKPKGQIKVGCIEQDGFWRFSVSDNGPGIDEKYFEKVFNMFQTLSPQDGVESTGIGLSIVKKIAELNGGRVWVESEVGKASTFFFTLPKQETQAENEKILANIVS